MFIEHGHEYGTNIYEFVMTDGRTVQRISKTRRDIGNVDITCLFATALLDCLRK